MAVTRSATVSSDRFKAVLADKSAMWINLARVSAIIAAVGVLYSPTVASVALVMTYVAFAVSGQAGIRLRQVFRRPAVYWGVVFLGVVLIGMTYASVPWADRWVDVFKWRTILWFIVVLSIFDDERWKVRLMVTFVGGAAIGLAGSFAGSMEWITLWRNPNGLLRNWGTQGMAFAVAAVVCFWIVMQNTLSRRMRWIGLVLGLLYILNIVFISYARSGYAVLGLGLAVLFLWKGTPMQRLIVGSGLLLAAVLAFSLSPLIHHKVTLGISEWEHEAELTNITAMGLRRVYYVNTLEILQDHWLFGLGTGGFRAAYTKHVANKYDSSDFRAQPTGDPHNQYLAVLVQHGIGGLAIFLVWIVAIARDQASLPAYRMLALAILTGWCVTSLFSSHFRTFAEGHLLTTFLGALLATAPEEIQEGGARDAPIVSSS